MVNKNKKANSPLVSIVTPTYNSADTIARAITSVLSQTFTNYEIIVVDDASTDSTVEIVNRYIEEGAPIKIHSLESNSGAGVARSSGLQLASGEYVALLDADDFWFERKLEVQVAEMNNGADLCFNSYLRPVSYTHLTLPTIYSV